MERIRVRQMGKPSFILTSDWHLREDTPICFTGDFQKEQWDAVLCIADLQRKHGCPVLHAGDLFDHWKPSPHLLTMSLLCLPSQFYTVYGQHDLPQHNLNLKGKSGLRTLEAAGRVHVLPSGHYGQEPDKAVEFLPLSVKVFVWHHLMYKGETPFPGATGGQSSLILRKYPLFDLMVTGDNHQAFITTYGDQILVNPGPLTRQTADQIDFKPRVYLYYAETKSVEPVFLPISEGVISVEHITTAKEHEARLTAFVSHLNSDWEIGIKFEDNLKSFVAVNKISAKTMEIINKAID